MHRASRANSTLPINLREAGGVGHAQIFWSSFSPIQLAWMPWEDVRITWHTVPLGNISALSVLSTYPTSLSAALGWWLSVYLSIIYLSSNVHSSHHFYMIYLISYCSVHHGSDSNLLAVL